jgi:type II secretory pathway pseudopilin PulG
MPGAYSPVVPPYTTPLSPRKSRVGLIIGIVLVVVIVIGLGGYFAFQNGQQQIAQAAKDSEQTAANQGINQLQITCFSARTDNSTLYYYYGTGFSGYETTYETFGVYNPTRFAMGITWTMTFNFPSVGWVLADTESFQLTSGATAHPIFAFRVTGSQLNSLPPNPDLSRYTATVDGSYNVAGTYATYSLTQHQSYNSSTNFGSGVGSTSGLPKC